MSNEIHKHSQSTTIVVILSRIVSVRKRMIPTNTNGQVPSFRKTSAHSGIHQSTDLTFTRLRIRSWIQHLDDRDPRSVSLIRLTDDFVSLGILSGDGIILHNGGCEGGGEHDFRIRFGVSTLVVDLASIREGSLRLEGELSLEGGLVKVDGAVVGYLC